MKRMRERTYPAKILLAMVTAVSVIISLGQGSISAAQAVDNDSAYAGLYEGSDAWAGNADNCETIYIEETEQEGQGTGFGTGLQEGNANASASGSESGPSGDQNPASGDIGGTTGGMQAGGAAGATDEISSSDTTGANGGAAGNDAGGTAGGASANEASDTDGTAGITDDAQVGGTANTIGETAMSEGTAIAGDGSDLTELTDIETTANSENTELSEKEEHSEDADHTGEAEDTEEADDEEDQEMLLLALSSEAFLDPSNYNLNYFASQGYQIVCFGNAVINQHTNGGVLVGGNLTELQGCAGIADSRDAIGSSYIAGYVTPLTDAWEGGGFNHAGQQHPPATLYVGSSNTITNNGKTLNGHGNANGEGYNHWGEVAYNDSYIDWSAMWTAMTNFSAFLQRSSTIDYTQFVDWEEMTIQAGNSVSFIGSGQKNVKINIQGASNTFTVINILDYGTVYLPEIRWYNGSSLTSMGEGNDQPVIFNFPNATEVYLPSFPAQGHIIAPNAHVEIPGSQYNGTIICSSINASGEGHLCTFWRDYPQPAVEPTTAHILANKEFVNGALSGNDFAFELTGINGAPMPDGSSNGCIQIRNHADGRIDFGEITYSEAGTWQYTISEVAGAYAGNEPHIVYDSQIFQVTVTVTEAGGELAAEVSYRDAQGNLLTSLQEGQTEAQDVTGIQCEPPSTPQNGQANAAGDGLPVFHNYRNLSLRIHKVNGSEHNLTQTQYSQIRFRITRIEEDGSETLIAGPQEYGTWMPDGNGYFCLSGALKGTYRIEEIQTAEGYALPGDEILIDVSADGTISLRGGNTAHVRLVTEGSASSAETSELLVKNYLYIHMPVTGSRDALLCMAAGAAVIAAGVLMLGNNRRTCKRCLLLIRGNKKR